MLNVNNLQVFCSDGNYMFLTPCFDFGVGHVKMKATSFSPYSKRYQHCWQQILSENYDFYVDLRLTSSEQCLSFVSGSEIQA